MDDIEPVVLTIDAFREALGVSRGTVYAMIRNDEVRVVYIRSRMYIPATEPQRIANGEPLIPDGATLAEKRAVRARHEAERAARAAAKSARGREWGRAGGRPRKTDNAAS